MKVIYIKNYPNCIGIKPSLTLNKEYLAEFDLTEPFKYFIVKNDRGVSSGYDIKRFKVIE